MTRVQRALAKADKILERVGALHRALTSDDANAREQALIAIEALVLSNRGSSEADHRTQLVLGGLQAAVDAYLGEGAPQAIEYEASADKDALLAEAALAELRAEYPDETFSAAEVAASVRAWAAEHGARR